MIDSFLPLHLMLMTTLAQQSAPADETSTPAWVIGMFAVMLVFNLVILLLQVASRREEAAQRELNGKDRELNAKDRESIEVIRTDIQNIWKRLDYGENVFVELRQADAEGRVISERMRGHLEKAMVQSFASRDEHRRLDERVRRVELDLASRMERITSSLEGVHEKLASIARQQRQNEKKGAGSDGGK